MKTPITLLLFLFFLSGCYTVRKAERQVIKAGTHYPQLTSQYCARTYPPTEQTLIETQYIPGEIQVFADTLIVYDTLTQTQTRYLTRTIKQTDTIYCNRTTQVTNTAALQALEQQKTTLQSQLAAAEKSIARKQQMKLVLWWAAGILLCYTIARWLLKAYTPITLP